MLVKFHGYDKPPVKLKKQPKLVEMQLIPDLSHAVAEYVGASQHPYEAREEEVKKAVRDLARN